MKPATKDRLFVWGAAPMLAAVLVVLAVLQYRWSGQVSAATMSQMQANLKIALFGFRQDFTRELAGVCAVVRSAVDDPGPGPISPVRISQQLERWQRTAAHPGLVSHVFILQNVSDEQLLRLDPAREQMDPVSWPAGFDRLRQRLRELSALQDRHAEASPHVHGFHRDGRASGTHSRDPFPVWGVDQSIPALVGPLRLSLGPDGVPYPAATGWVILQLNPDTLQKELLPELAQKYFATVDYRVAVRESGGAQQRLLYSSGGGFGEDSAAAVDSSMALFGPPFRHSDTPQASAEMFALFSRLPANDRQAQGQKKQPGNDKGKRQSQSYTGRSPNPERPLRFEPLYASTDPSVWEVVVQNHQGSLEAAVNTLRWRNLSVSFGVLVLLAVTMATVLIASQRARRLAMLQMDFVAGVSHELRTPLAVISSAAENITHGVVADQEQIVRYGASILKQSRRLTQLVEQVLVFAASQQSSQRYQLRPLDVAEVIDAALENTANMITSSTVTVERRVEPGLPLVAADFAALSQCLQNLITNAVKYGGERRWVAIRAASRKENGAVREITITVEDRGIGIASSDMKHIFDPFYRSPAVSSSSIHGTGLGLPLARTLIEAMRGRITVESELGKGTQFTIHLPVAEGPQAVTAMDNEASAATS